VAAGQLLRARGFSAKNVDVAFTSELQRAHETCELALASMAGPDQHTWSSDRIRRDWRLNERHYGCVQGEFKKDPALVERFGAHTLRSWRRSMHEAPPSLEESHPDYRAPPMPSTESLADCQHRALECFRSTIFPTIFDEEDLPTPPDQRTVVIVAHSNTIRSLMASFDEVPEHCVPKLHVPNGVPILYSFDRATRLPVTTKLQSYAGESHARWLLSPCNLTRVQTAVKPGGQLSRALFNSLRVGGEKHLTATQLESGLRELLKENDGTVDCAVAALGKKLVRETSFRKNQTWTREEFEDRAAQVWSELHDHATDY